MIGQAGENSPDPIALAQQGDVEAIGVLYDQHHEALFRYIWSRTGDRDLAEDLTSDVFMRMLSALPNYRSSTAPFRAWLYRIARNLLVDYYRKKGGRISVSLNHSVTLGDDDNPISIVEHKLTLERAHHALAKLDETQREVVALRFLGGLSLQEVATVLEKSENAIKALQHRGLTALRQALAQP